MGHRPGHWLSGQSRSCPLSTVPVTRHDFHGLHVLPLTAGDSLPRPSSCSAFGDPQCPALRGGSTRRESPREPAGMEGDPEAVGPEPSFLLNFLLGETCMLDLEARGCGPLWELDVGESKACVPAKAGSPCEVLARGPRSCRWQALGCLSAPLPRRGLRNVWLQCSEKTCPFSPLNNSVSNLGHFFKICLY